MRVHESVEIRVIQEHLRAKKTGVKLELDSMPGLPSEHRGFRGQLDEGDVEKLILWWEFEKHTLDQNCKIADLLPSASSLPRVKSFVSGDPTRGFRPLDLSSATNMELVVVTDDLANGWLYIIDGNNRAIAQSIRSLSFEDSSFFACVHPEMHRWAYIPMYYKKLWLPR